GVSESGFPPRRPTARRKRRRVTSSRSSIRSSTESGSATAGAAAGAAFFAVAEPVGVCAGGGAPCAGRVAGRASASSATVRADARRERSGSKGFEGGRRECMGIGDDVRGQAEKRDSLAGSGGGRSHAAGPAASGARPRPAALPGRGALPRLIGPMLVPHRVPVRAALRPALLALLAGLAAAPVLADPVRIVTAAERGVPLRVTVGAWSLSAPGPDGRVHVNPLDGAHVMGFPGRPGLPAYSALIAVPPDARPSVRVLSTSGEQVR